MFKNLGKLNYLSKNNEIKINLNELKIGINFFDNFIIYQKNRHLKIYSRKCDHAGGKIMSKDGNAICPIHMWKFNPATGFYNNGIKKKEVEYLIDNNFIKIKDTSYFPKINQFKGTSKTEIRFFNHAFLKINGDNFSFSIDPWAIGPAFNTGWWLKKPTKNDWIDQLNSSNFIYISHNHPDHLHPLTLSKINKNIKIVVPNFVTKSTEMYIKDLGFYNVEVLDFNVQYNLANTKLNFSLFKSGDFREDSGLYFSNGEFTGLLSVDANMINFDRLPKVNFYGSSFAGGASGYPIMFDNYSFKEKENISIKNKKFIKKRVCESLKKIMPNYFMPYAGFFNEKLRRDNQILKNNKKNSIEDYSQFCKLNKINILNVYKNDFYKFNGNKLIYKKNKIVKETKDLIPEKYLEYFKKEYKKIDEDYIKEYFLKSNFKDNLLLFICLTDDNFKLLNKNYLIDFSKKKILFSKTSKYSKNFLNGNSKFKKLVLKIRRESFLNTIYNKLPWEDLSIGFQCKILRNPNLYNANFWHHFTNVYITSTNVRSVTNCTSCENLNHYVDNLIFK
ncbi:MBL fold metallo-hydrolase [Candidatus Pelagibacter sp.]|nr:MBL fold metallo-hydrolase [Candidatus Pelagibacter sp.]